MKLLDLKVAINGLSETLSVQLSNHDTVQDIRQIILEKPECCYRTCFSLYLEKTRLDDFMELHDIPGLTDNSVIKVVDGIYFLCIFDLFVKIGKRHFFGLNFEFLLLRLDISCFVKS